MLDPPVSIYKGSSLPKDAVTHLLSRGLQSALYTIKAADLKEDLFGTLVPCTFQVDSQIKPQSLNSASSCILEFDGASKGNPGQAGAGAVLRANDGSLICRLREGLGVATCNVAEYRAMILGLKYALQKGYTKIHVQGDSMLVCMQIQGSWRVRHPNMSKLYKQAKTLKDKFLSFQITHVLRKFNSEADVQANLATSLADGQIQEDSQSQ